VPRSPDRRASIEGTATGRERRNGARWRRTNFTLGERAALVVVSRKVQRREVCCLAIVRSFAVTVAPKEWPAWLRLGGGGAAGKQAQAAGVGARHSPQPHRIVGKGEILL